MSKVEERVDRLESLLGHFIVNTDVALRRLETSLEAFKDEMRAFKDEMRAFKDEMGAFKDEMRAFKDEMRAFKDEVNEDRKRMNKMWGELANKMGTLVEDIFIPSFEIMLKRYFNVIPKRVSSRMKLRDKDREVELDIVGFTEKEVFIVEVKSSPDRAGYVDDFIEKLKILPDFMPEIKDYKVIPIYAGLTMSDKTVEYLTKNNIYAMIVKGDILEIVNFEDLKDNEYR